MLLSSFFSFQVLFLENFLFKGKTLIPLRIERCSLVFFPSLLFSSLLQSSSEKRNENENEKRKRNEDRKKIANDSRRDQSRESLIGFKDDGEDDEDDEREKENDPGSSLDLLSFS